MCMLSLILGSGKFVGIYLLSALVIQFVSHRFTDYHDPTIEDAYQQQARIDGEPAQLDILDTAGQLEFTTMREQYMRHGEGFVICYSITDRRSFDEVLNHKNLIDRVRCKENIPIIITGNKCDLEHKRKVSTEEGARLAEQLGAPFFETSAVSRQCVDDTFHGIVREIRRKEHEELLSLEKLAKKRQRKKRMHAFFNRFNFFRRRSNSP
ncbi:GTP-binding protein Rit2-like [Ruditapes philippinarum]|uniref:GTP-binding protein Rit2-like n=1 Tax=Ruditapes philippinarum TaxID=129788 RepID=UPI00295A6460|nr:GTP-binding protein Rit2-like [Ruditapes philippinarum]